MRRSSQSQGNHPVLRKRSVHRHLTIDLACETLEELDAEADWVGHTVINMGHVPKDMSTWLIATARLKR